MESSTATTGVTEYLDMLPPPSASLGGDGADIPAWVDAFVAERAQAATSRNMGCAVQKILRAAAARCSQCSVDQLSCAVLPPIIQRLQNTQAEREENRFEANQVRRAAIQAGAKMEGAKTQSRSKHFAKIETDLRRQLQELEQVDSDQADAVEQLEPLCDFIRRFIRTRLVVNPAKLQTDVDRMLALGLNGKDLSMEGSGTILHTAAEAGQTDAIRGWLQLLAEDNDGDSDDETAQPVCVKPPVTASDWKGKRVAVVETSSPHFGNRGIVTSVSLRTRLVNIACDDGTSLRLKLDHVQRDDRKTDTEIEAERAYQVHAPKAVRRERLGAVHIDARSPNGATPLYAAAYAGHLNAVALLLREKADVHAKRDDGCTAMHAAARNGHVKVVEALIDGGSDLSRPGKRGVTPLCMLLASVQRARQCVETKDTQAAAFVRSTNVTHRPMNATEFDSGQAHIKEKAEAWTKLRRLEQTLNRFLDIGGQVLKVRREAQRCFRNQDKDHSGHLSRNELNRLFDGRLEKHSSTDESQMLSDYTNKDGGIHWHNFWRWWWRQHKNGLWVPRGTSGEDISEAMRLGYRAAFITESVEALWRDRWYTGMIPLLEQMVAEARSEAKSVQARLLAESEQRQENEYARQQAEWQERMKAANSETRRKRTAVWRTNAGQTLLKTLQDAEAADLICEKDVRKLKLKVQSGIIDVRELQQTWKRKWLLHCTRKGIASANSAPLVTTQKKRRPVLLESTVESSDEKNDAQPSAPWFDPNRRMYGSVPNSVVNLQGGSRLSQPDGYDRRRILTKGILHLVHELHATSDNRALALWALAVLCSPNTTEGVRARRLVLNAKAVKQIGSLLMNRDARQSEVNAFAPAILAMLVYEDESIAPIIESTGCIGTLVHLVELDQRVEVRMSVLCCLVNLAVDGACRRECRRLELARVVRPLCLDSSEVGNMALTILDCLKEQTQLEPAAAERQAEKDMLNSPEVTRARETLASQPGSLSFPSVSTSDSPSSATSTSAGQSELEDLTVELPFLIQDFPHVRADEIRRICEAAGGITDAAVSRLTALNEVEQAQQKTGIGEASKTDVGLAGDEMDSEATPKHFHSTENGESAWATESFAAFSFVDNLQALKPVPKLKVPVRPLHMLGGLFGNKATKYDLEETFKAFDANGDGVITCSELKTGLSSLGVKLTSKEIERLMSVFDTDNRNGLSVSEFCRQFQRSTGGQLSDEEQRTVRWHTKPTSLARKSQMQILRQAHSIKPSIDKALADDNIDRIGQAILAERDARLTEVVSEDRKRIRAAVMQAQKVYQRSDELVQLSEKVRDQKLKDVEDARRGVRQFSRQKEKLLGEVQRAKDKLASLIGAASHGGFVHRVDFTNPCGTPTVARRWLQLGNGELVWHWGNEQLLDEAAAVSKSITHPAEPKLKPSTLSIKSGNRMQLEVEGAGSEQLPGWLTEAREKLASDKDDFGLSPLQSPLSTHKSFSRLSPLVSPVIRSANRVSSLASPSSTRSNNKTKSRRRADIKSWDSPLRGPGSSHDVLSVAELALSIVTHEAALTCCTENDASDYIEEKERRERLRKSAREADRPMPRFESLNLKTTQHNYILRVVLGAPDSAGDNAYNFGVSEAKELEKWKVALEAGVQFAASHSYWEERVRQLQAKSIEANTKVAVYSRLLDQAEHALTKVEDNALDLEDARTRAEGLVEWSVADEAARTEQRQAELKAEKLAGILDNEFWPGVPIGRQRVVATTLMDGLSVH